MANNHPHLTIKIFTDKMVRSDHFIGEDSDYA